MMRPSIDLDADMSASEVLARLALNGFWISAQDPVAHARIEAVRVRLHRSFDDIARAFARDAHTYGAAIRRQMGTHVLWYARELSDVLGKCTMAPPGESLLQVLNLHEPDSAPPIEHDDIAGALLHDGVVMERGMPVAVSLGAGPVRIDVARSRSVEDLILRGKPGSSALPGDVEYVAPVGRIEPAVVVDAWPRIDAPECKAAAEPFDIVVGFAAAKQAEVMGGPVRLPFASKTQELEITIELSSGIGVDAPDGWSRTLRVKADDIANAQVRFRLVGTEPTNRERIWLTMLEVRYVIAGTVCGTAARPLVIVPANASTALYTAAVGTAWQSTPSSASPVSLVADSHAPDLTIEITKPDRNPSSGQYVCQIYSPHTLVTPRGPFPMDLGQDAKTFAKSMVEEIRQYGGNALLEHALEGIGRLVAERLPAQVFDALSEVAALASTKVPALLIVSAEPYVPWEIAWLDQPLDDKRPSFLGAQAVVGRWLRDGAPAPAAGAGTTSNVARPAVHPIASLGVSNLAVMQAWYKVAAGLRRLPMAEDEAKQLAKTYPGIALDARAEPLRDLLSATLQRNFDPIQVQAVHFAGHGDFDPTVPDSSAMFLEDGSALRSTLFRAAKYGGDRQPLLFLNACMLGIGGELLGDMAGFPGNALRGGFGGVLGALWEVDDDVAHDIALEFWRRALPPAPAHGEAIGTILRDLRAKYVPGAKPAPVATYLAYVYYGHPNLTLQRMP
ncbi:MAG: TCAD7 domain-containing protein [Dokdonella sp.]